MCRCCCSSLSPAPVLRQITASLKAPCGICLVNKQVMFTFKMRSLLSKRWNTIFLKSLKAALLTSILTCFFAHQWTTVTLFLGKWFQISSFSYFQYVLQLSFKVRTVAYREHTINTYYILKIPSSILTPTDFPLCPHSTSVSCKIIQLYGSGSSVCVSSHFCAVQQK